MFCGHLYAAVLLKVTAARPWSDACPQTDYSIIFNALNPSPASAKHTDGKDSLHLNRRQEGMKSRSEAGLPACSDEIVSWF